MEEPYVLIVIRRQKLIVKELINDMKTTTKDIWISKSIYGQEEKDAVMRVLDSGWLGIGKESAKFEQSMSDYVGVKHAMFVNSGSSALLLGLKALNLSPKAEVITCAAGFPSTLSPIIHCGFTPVLVDCELDTYNIDPKEVEKAITSKTEAIVFAHAAGNLCDMEALEPILNKYKSVEDACFVAKTRIPTKNGVKHIKDIKKGDKLFGFNGKTFVETEVMEVGNRLVNKDEVIAITFENGPVVRCTKGHPFYVKGKWIRAGFLKEGDEVWHSTVSEYLSWRRNFKYSIEGRKKVSLRMKTNNPSYNPEIVKKSSTHRFKRMTHIEKRVLQVIEENSFPIEYVGNAKLWIGDKEHGYRNPDFIYKRKKIVFEVYDSTFRYMGGMRGLAWKKSKESFYKSFGYKIVFLNLNGWVNRGKRDEIAFLLRRSISNGRKIKKIRTIRSDYVLNINSEPKGMVRVYNLRCKPYNNFTLTSGILVHNCDTLGGKYKDKMVGSFGTVSAFSFFASHHITAAGGGGMVLTNDQRVMTNMFSMRDWGKRYVKPGYYQRNFSAYDTDIDGIPYDLSYSYDTVGYNMKLIEIGAAFANEQFKRLPRFIEKRNQNHTYLTKYFFEEKKYDRFFIKPRVYPEHVPSWFFFIFILRDGVSFTRKQFGTYLEEHGVCTRPFFAGNITRQPALKDLPFKKVGTFNNANKLMEDALMIGVHPGLTQDDLEYITRTVDAFLEGK